MHDKVLIYEQLKYITETTRKVPWESTNPAKAFLLPTLGNTCQTYYLRPA